MLKFSCIQITRPDIKPVLYLTESGDETKDIMSAMRFDNDALALDHIYTERGFYRLHNFRNVYSAPESPICNGYVNLDFRPHVVVHEYAPVILQSTVEPYLPSGDVGTGENHYRIKGRKSGRIDDDQVDWEDVEWHDTAESAQVRIDQLYYNRSL